MRENRGHGATTVAEYEYDGLNQRIQKVVGADTYDYYNNMKWQAVVEFKNGAANRLNLFSAEYIDALAVTVTATARHFYTHDANYNITSAITPSAGVVERYSYSPYGKVTYRNANFTEKTSQTSAIGNNYLFTGRRFDPETGFYQFRNRYYSAETGRFVNRDPIRYNGSKWNLYGYVGSKPTVYIDPMGLLGCKVCGVTYLYRVPVRTLDKDMQGTPYRDLLQIAIVEEVRKSIKPTGIFIPIPINTGPVSHFNNARNLRTAHFLFAVAFAVCEEEAGDCRLFLDETGSTAHLNDKHITALDGKDHGDITSDGDVKKAKRKNSNLECNAELIFGDMPGGFSGKQKGKWIAFRLLVKQKFTIRDKNTGKIVYSGGHEVKISINADGSTDFSP